MPRVFLLTILTLACQSISAFAVDATPAFKAGAAAVNITPEEFPVSVNGGFADRQATKASDPLHARALVIATEKHTLALVVVDSCMIPRSIIDDAKANASKRTGIPIKNMLVSATHTHTAPTLAPVFQSEPNADYVRALPGKIADAIVAAHKNLSPAEIGFGRINEPSHLFNRRWKMKPGTLLEDPFGGTKDLVKMNPGHENPNLLEPAGPIDPELSIIFVRNPYQKVRAAFANYGLHYVGDRPALSADYFGVYAGKVEGTLKGEIKDGKLPPFVGAMFNGTSGDVNNVNFKEAAVKREPGERSRAVAESLAKATAKAYEETKFLTDGVLASAEEEIELLVRKPTPKDVARAKTIIEGAKDKKVMSKPEEVYALETIAMDKYPESVKLKLQAHRIGDLIITAIPCGVFTEIGLDLKKPSPLKRGFTISLANGYNGYLPTPAQHKLGGYETWRARSSYLEVDASDKIVKVLDKLTKEVAAVK